jgi:hypothetical protein
MELRESSGVSGQSRAARPCRLDAINQRLAIPRTGFDAVLAPRVDRTILLVSARETRTTLGHLIGGTIRLIPKEATRELVVYCALNTTLKPARLSCALAIIRRPKKIRRLSGSAPYANFTSS